MRKLKYILPIFLVASMLMSSYFLNYSLGDTQQGIRTLNWWDSGYHHRRMITLTEPGIADRCLEPVDVYLSFTPGEAVVNSIRVTFYNGSSWVEEPSQIWNETTYTAGAKEYYNSCTVTFLSNISKSQQKIYYIYYDEMNNTAPNYGKSIWAVARNSSAPVDEAYPWIYDSESGVNTTHADLIDIRTAYSNESASILLSDTVRPGSDWGGPVCGIITAKYNDSYALNTYDGYRASSFMFVGEFAIDPFNRDSSTASVYRVNVGPNNPAEAWIPGGGKVYIEENGPLFVMIRIITSDGGYESAGYTVNNGSASIHMSITGHTDTVYPSSPGNHGSGFFNYTYTYRFYYHGPNLLAELDQRIQVNIQSRDGATPQAYVKNYGDWPHILTLTSNNTSGAALQNRHAWYGSKYFLFNESSYSRRRDFPVEKWCAWYDNDSGSDPSIGIITTNDVTGWEVLSLVVSGIGPNIMFQQILREGHQGDMYLMPNGTVYRYNYFVYTSVFGSNYTEIRQMAQNLNARILVSQLDSDLAVLDPASQHITLPATDSAKILVNFSNPVTGQGIINATIQYYADWLPEGTWTEMFQTDPDAQPGVYERYITAPSSIGNHTITLMAQKMGYPTSSLNITMMIIAKTKLTGSASALSLSQGESDIFYLTYQRSDRGVLEPIEGAEFNITGWGYTYEVSYLGEGRYEVKFTAPSNAIEKSYNVMVEVSSANYESQTFNATIIVKVGAPAPVFDRIMLYGALAAIGAIVVYGVYNYHFKYPPIVRKIRKLRGKILKRKIPTSQIRVKGRDEIFAEIVARKTSVISGIQTIPEEPAPRPEAYESSRELSSGGTQHYALDASEKADTGNIPPLQPEVVGEEVKVEEKALGDFEERLKSIKSLPETERDRILAELKNLSVSDAEKMIEILEEQYGKDYNG